MTSADGPRDPEKARTFLRPGQTWFLWAMAAGVIAMFSFVILPYVDPTPPKLGGDSLPAFDLEVLDSPGDRLSSENLVGSPLIIDFWASWCMPCREQSKALSAFVAGGASGVQVIGVATSDEKTSAREFVKKHDPKYVNVYDEGGALARSVGVENLPTLLVVDENGVIVQRQSRILSVPELERLARDLAP